MRDERLEREKVAQRELITAEQFWNMPLDGRKYELVRGELIEMTPPGGQHGRIASDLDYAIKSFVKERQTGQVYVESGYKLFQDPDVVHGPDISFMSRERIPAEGEPTGFWLIPPDLAVEIVSPGDRAAELDDKVSNYLAAGVRLVWVVNPRTQTVMVYKPDGTVRRLSKDDMLDGEDVLPGFSYRVGDLF